jgi:hypothetical protein
MTGLINSLIYSTVNCAFRALNLKKDDSELKAENTKNRFMLNSYDNKIQTNAFKTSGILL